MQRRRSTLPSTNANETSDFPALELTTTQTEDDIAPSEAERHHSIGDGSEEKPSTPRRVPFLSRANVLGPIVRDHVELPLLACCLVTGMVDAASFRNWGMFVGMQTGKSRGVVSKRKVEKYSRLNGC